MFPPPFPRVEASPLASSRGHSGTGWVKPRASGSAHLPLPRYLPSAVSNAIIRWASASRTGALDSPDPPTLPSAPNPRSLHALELLPGRRSTGHHQRGGWQSGRRRPSLKPGRLPGGGGGKGGGEDWRDRRASLWGCGKEEGQRLRGAQRRAGAEAARIRANGGAVAAQVAAPRYPEAAPARPPALQLGVCGFCVLLIPASHVRVHAG